MALSVKNMLGGGSGIPNPKINIKCIENVNAFKYARITGTFNSDTTKVTQYNTEVTSGPSSTVTCSQEAFDSQVLSDTLSVVVFYQGASNATMYFAVYNTETKAFSNVVGCSGCYSPCIIKKSATEFYICCGSDQRYYNIYTCTYDASNNTITYTRESKYTGKLCYNILHFKHNGSDYVAFGNSWTSEMSFYNLSINDGYGDPVFTFSDRSLNNFSSTGINDRNYPLLVDEVNEIYLISYFKTVSGGTISLSYKLISLADDTVNILGTYDFAYTFDGVSSISSFTHWNHAISGASMVGNNRMLQPVTCNTGYSNVTLNYLVFEFENGVPILKTSVWNGTLRGYTGYYNGANSRIRKSIVLGKNHIAMPITDGVYKGMSSASNTFCNYNRYGEAYIDDYCNITRLTTMLFLRSSSTRMYLLNWHKLPNGNVLIFFVTNTTYSLNTSSVGCFAVVIDKEDATLHCGISDYRNVSDYSYPAQDYYMFECKNAITSKNAVVGEIVEAYEI